MKFKRKILKDQFKRLNPKTQAITLFAAYYMKERWDHEATITSIYRSQKEQDKLRLAGKTTAKRSAHQDYRAVDIRLRDIKYNRIFAGKHFAIFINESFPRCDGKPTAIAHGKGSSFHLHIQTPGR